MKAIVLKPFVDKYTGARYETGAVLDITEERAREILSVGPLIKCEKPKRKKAAK